MSKDITTKLIQEAKRLEEDALYSFKGHHNAAESWKDIHYWIGIPTVLLAASGSLSAFNNQNIVAGVLAALATFLTILSIFLDPSEKQNSHKVAGASFGALKNQARFFYEVEINLEKDNKKLLNSIKTLTTKRDDLNTISPNIPEKSYLKAKKDIEAGSNEYLIDKVEK